MLMILIILALVLVDVWLFAIDRYIWSFIVLVSGIVASYFFVPEVATFIATYGWFEVLKYGVPGYFLLGAATASLKWVSFARGVADRLADLRKTFDSTYEIPMVSTNKKPESDPLRDPRNLQAVAELIPLTGDDLVKHRRQAFLKFVNNYAKVIFKRRCDIPYKVDSVVDDKIFVGILTPRTRDYIERVSFWVLQWPIVLINFILEDLLIKLANNIARLIDTVFNRLARLFVGNAVKGL